MLSRTDTLVNEEVVWNSWPSEGIESTWSEEEGWEILNETTQEIGNRHWFKQNYIRHMPQSATTVTYH